MPETAATPPKRLDVAFCTSCFVPVDDEAAMSPCCNSAPVRLDLIAMVEHLDRFERALVATAIMSANEPWIDLDRVRKANNRLATKGSELLARLERALEQRNRLQAEVDRLARLLLRVHDDTHAVSLNCFDELQAVVLGIRRSVR